MTLWIESHTTVSKHPKTRKLARRLDISILEAVGLLHVLWHWAIEFAPDGDLSKHDPEDIAIGALYEGDPNTLLDALASSGYVDKTEDDGLVLHDWWEFAGKLIAIQEAGSFGNHKRWHEARGIVVPTCSYCTNDRGRVGGDIGGDIGGESGGKIGGESTYLPNLPTTPTSPTKGDQKVRAALLKAGCSEDAADYAIRELALRREAGEEIRSPLGWCKKVAADYTKQRPSCTGCGATRVSLVNTDRGPTCMECRRGLDAEEGKQASHG